MEVCSSAMLKLLVAATVWGRNSLSRNYTASRKLCCRSVDYLESEIGGLALEQGYAKAQYALGSTYYEGKDLAQNYATAANWYRKAADQGYAEAESYLGFMYSNGLGVEHDDGEQSDGFARLQTSEMRRLKASLYTCIQSVGVRHATTRRLPDGTAKPAGRGTSIRAARSTQ